MLNVDIGFANMITSLLLLISLSSYVLPDECVSASLSPGGQSLMVEASDMVRLETSDTQECEVRLRLVAVGGGGDGDAFTGNAGGSGYVEYKEVLSQLNLNSYTSLDIALQ